MKGKRFLYELIFLLSFLQGFGQMDHVVKHRNKIDNIQNAKEIEHLLKSIDNRYEYFAVNDLKWKDKDFKKLCDSLQVKPFVKADFDNNSYTDLLVIGDYPDAGVYCIMDSGINRFSIKMISRRFADCLPVISKSNNITYITNYTFKEKEPDVPGNPKIIKSKKLVYKFGGFIEYNDTPENYIIEKIECKTSACYGPCPIFNLSIDSNRMATYNAIPYNKPDGKEKFSGIISKEDYSKLSNLLNYINFPELNNNYEVSWTDDQTITLTITYDGGETKSITDYGLAGTYGLSRVYGILFEWRSKVQWR